eukprot:1156864-Rhodomonas_salina.1
MHRARAHAYNPTEVSSKQERGHCQQTTRQQGHGLRCESPGSRVFASGQWRVEGSIMVRVWSLGSGSQRSGRGRVQGAHLEPPGLDIVAEEEETEAADSLLLPLVAVVLPERARDRDALFRLELDGLLVQPAPQLFLRHHLLLVLQHVRPRRRHCLRQPRSCLLLRLHWHALAGVWLQH